MNRDLTSLDRLHDILVPDPVPWWPVAPGWWWVMGAALLFLFVVQLRAFARWQHNRYRRQALGELAALEASLKDPAHRPAVLLELAVLLKRTALTAYPRGEIASLSGPEWSSFLDRTAVGSRFSQGSGQVLHSAVHDPRTVAALEERTVHDLMREVREWIRHHQPTVTAP
ncbi:MAG: DUF4381 domain-containing protein [Verrucomicrobiales bacterium]|nr:DUF4381 domain-containing protein [Verrucomicrobiales bacterium]